MYCTITSSRETMRYRNLQSVTIPAFSGEMQVLPGHAEAFILLGKGNIIIKQKEGQKEKIEITSAECHIRHDEIVIIL